MTGRLVTAAVISATVTAAAQSHVVFRDGTAESLFKTSRNAIGGEGAVSSIHSLLLRGTARVADGGPEERQVEILVQAPDGILRIETAPGFEKRSGFHGNNLLTSMGSGDALERPPANMRGPMITAERARMGRLLLGMAAMPLRPGWLTLRSVRTAVTTTDPRSTMGTNDPTGAGTSLEADRAGQRILEGSAADRFFIRLFFDGGSFPSRIQYEASGSQITTEFSDRRRVSGLLLPYHITTTSGGRVVDELILREIVVNPKLTAADFER
jgi:hypothetical protein